MRVAPCFVLAHLSALITGVHRRAPAPIRSGALGAVLALALALVFGAGPAPVSAAIHPPPRLWVEVFVEAESVRVEVTAYWDLWRTWAPDARFDDTAAPLDPSEIAAALRSVQTELADRLRLTVDGEALAMTAVQLTSSRDLPDSHDYPITRVEMRGPIEAPARRVGLLWPRFDGIATEEAPEEHFVGFFRVGAGGELFSLAPDEPEVFWHAAASELVSLVPPSDEAAFEPQLHRPKAPVLLSGAGLLLLVALWRRRALALGLGLPLVAAGGGWWWLDVRPVEVAPPETPEQAFSIFEPLHANVFRAFEQTSEDDVYAVLSASVEPSVLDPLYEDVFESLLLRDQGGASAIVERMEVLDRELLEVSDPGVEPPAFELDWTWRAHLHVSHYGHVHRRVNEHCTRYQVRHDGRRWRIAAWEVLENDRVE